MRQNSMTMECPVCTRSVRTSFACPACEFSACVTCVKRYLVEYASDPACMHCGVAFERDTLLALSRSFVDGPLKRKRETVLVERELAMMPATQARAQRERKRRHIVEDIAHIDETRRNLTQTLRALQTRRTALMRQHTVLTMHRDDDDTESVQQRRAFVHACAWEGCRGFVSSAYKCGTCDRSTCRECNAPMPDGVEHVCNPDDVASVQLIRARARKCPCGELIEKISGCDQMWCPTCKTAWSWRTGLVVTGPMHNPHWYEYQRTRRPAIGRDPRDIPCGDRPNIVELLAFIPLRGDTAIVRWYTVFHRLLAQVDGIIEEHAWARRPQDDTVNADLRVQYMLGDFDVEVFKRKLQQREKKRLKKRDIALAWEVLTLGASDILRGMLLEQTTDRLKLLEDTRRELLVLLEFSNENARAVGLRYNCIVNTITMPEFL